MSPGPLETKYPSPDGRFAFVIDEWEARMSLWVSSPTLLDLTTREELLRFRAPEWSLDSADWTDAASVRLQLRRYPGDHDPTSFGVVIDCTRRTASLDAAAELALADLERALDAAYTRGQRGPRR